ncbi:hypothetical protein OG21DRAFT_518609 [Imleria badia]|nr:hypothetical protein OG21DRAFT_518609 [Imleria badia]
MRTTQALLSIKLLDLDTIDLSNATDSFSSRKRTSNRAKPCSHHHYHRAHLVLHYTSPCLSSLIQSHPPSQPFYSLPHVQVVTRHLAERMGQQACCFVERNPGDASHIRVSWDEDRVEDVPLRWTNSITMSSCELCRTPARFISLVLGELNFRQRRGVEA